MTGVCSLASAVLVLLPQSQPDAGIEAKPDPSRAQRLERQKAAIEAQIAAMESHGQEERFLAALRATLDATPVAEEESAPFVPVKNGLVPLGAFSSFVKWQSPRASRDRPVANDVTLPNHPFAAIVDFDKQVRARGVDFLLVVLPSRLEIHPELVCDLESSAKFPGMGLGTQRFLLELTLAGVEAVSLTGPFAAARADRPLYLRTDPHWTPQGAELAARVVADRIARFPWFEHGPLVEGRDFTASLQDFGYDPGEALAKRGAEIEPVRGNALVSGGKLLDAMDKDGPFVALGDSNLRLHSMTACDFCSQLFRFTGWKVDPLQAYGGAAEQVRRKLARRTPDQWKGKKLVVWLVPETLLVTSDWWKLVPLGE